MNMFSFIFLLNKPV